MSLDSRRADILPGMTRLELSRRVECLEEDFTAISDTSLEIKGTVDRHTRTLAEHGHELLAIRETQAQHGEMLTHHGEMLTEILRRLDTR